MTPDLGNISANETRPHVSGSIHRRLLGGLLISTAIFGTIAMIDTWLDARQTANAFADRVLAGSVEMIGDRILLDPDDEVDVYVPYSALSVLSAEAQDRVYFRVDGPAGVEAGYPDLPRADQAVINGAVVFSDGMFQGENARIASQRREFVGNDTVAQVTITVAETTRARQDLMHRILLRSALRLMGMIIGASLIVWISVSVSLRPLRQLSAVIARRGADDLRPISTPVPKEVSELVTAMNSFMLRLNTALGGLRNFTGNTAHQLRTPLTTARTQLMLIERAETPETRADAISACDRALVQIEGTIRHLRILARLDASAPVADLAPQDVECLIRELVAERIPMAFKRGIDLGFESDGPFLVKTSAILLSEAVANLIDNALLYAGTGAHVTVRTSTAAHLIEVEDNGPGLPPALGMRQPARYARGLTDGSGTGLGLSVAYEIAQFLGAVMAMTVGQDGRGLVVKITFPDA